MFISSFMCVCFLCVFFPKVLILFSTEICAIQACHGYFGRVACALNVVFKNCGHISLMSKMRVGPRLSLGSLH